MSVPEIDLGNGAVHRLGVLLDKLNGLLEAHGESGEPLIRPILFLDGTRVALDQLSWVYESQWVPRFSMTVAASELVGWIVAPIDSFGGEHGVVFRLQYRNATGTAVCVELGWTGHWAGTDLSHFRARPVTGEIATFHDPWTGSSVLTLGTPAPLVAIGWQGGDGVLLAEGKRHRWAAGRRAVVPPDGVLTADLFVSVAPETDGASTGALHLRRRGFAALYAETRAWLDAHRLPVPDDALGERVNRHLFFNYFFAQGDCLDTARPVLLTSRSSHYYVSAAFWSRDAYLWTFPALLLTEPVRARTVLVESLRACGPRVADHALYLNGTRFYPGFELDQAVAPVLAVWRYIDATGDNSVLDERATTELVRQMPEVLERWYDARLGLYGTFLLPSDDPTDYPYVTTCNALVATAFDCLAKLASMVGDSEQSLRHAEKAASVREAVHKWLVADGPYGPMWAWACNSRGKHEFRDEPPLGLRLLRYFGMTAREEEIEQNTLRWLVADYAHYYPGRFGGAGAPHFPYPSGFDLANRLLSGDIDPNADPLIQYLDAPMDQGFGCESWDPDTGVVRTGAAMASMSGLLAWSCWAYLVGHRRWDEPLRRESTPVTQPPSRIQQ